MRFLQLGKVTIYQKISALILLAGGLFLGLCLSLYYYTTKQEQEVYNATTVHFDNEVNALLALNAQTNTSNIVDIVYWDEFVKYLKDRNQHWFEENITSSVETYKADYLGIYDIHGKFVRKASTGKIQSRDFIPQGVFAKLDQKRLYNFYIDLPEGKAAVYGASVHGTDDIYDKVTKPAGYFFIVRLLDASYFAELERINNSKIAFLAQNVQPAQGYISTTKNLISWDGKTIARLVFKRPFDVSFYTTKSMLALLTASFILIILCALWYIRQWVYKPLSLVTGIFENKEETDMELLKNIPNEFQYIGKLFKDNDRQKKLLEQAKAKAEESDRLKSSFLTNISHEIRTPMNAIVGFSDLLLKADLTPKERQEYMAIVHKSGANLVSIIDDLIEMSKIDTNQVSPNDDAVNIDAVLNELHESIQIAIPAEKQLDFQIRKPVNRLLGKTITDQVKLKQVLTNLITNAIKYTENGFVIFGYEVNACLAELEFTVQDSGIGIPAEHQAKIFDRFHRIENDFTIKAGGLGLGLAISKAYVKMMGGRITIDSSDASGTTISFTIPLRYGSAIPSANLQGSANVVETAHSITILVAEDDNINFLLIQKMLHKHTHHIIRAKDGQEAIDICTANAQIDLVLMDIKMPVKDGYTAFDEIKSFRPNLPVIAQTAYASSEDEKKILASGFRGYISKPINKERLFELIEGITASKYSN